MALVDADYNFIFADVGTNGRVCDSTVWSQTKLKEAIENKALSIPDERNFPNSNISAPMVIIADITPKHRICNNRICRARRVVENAFGILASRFEVFRAPIRVRSINSINQVILACVALHNFLRKNASSRHVYSPPGCVDSEDLATGTITPGDWRRNSNAGLQNLTPSGANYSVQAKLVREKFADYFMSPEGMVSWQWNRAE